MTTVMIEDSTPEGKWLLELIKGHKSVTVVSEKKKNFRQALTECKAVSVDVFFDELDARIEKWPDRA
ncbi:hypothetical protein FACS1894159_10820 [Bacteroidia bacterium]|nr:hypothetical protein FACS1894159_10820 [Bacteroidia bacterium]